MRGKLLAVMAMLGLVFGSASAMAQAPTGDIVGRVVDASGAVLPGVVVTVSGGALIQPQSAVTGDTGTYLFPGLQPGDTYTVKFELTGFRTVVVERVAVSVGGNTDDQRDPRGLGAPGDRDGLERGAARRHPQDRHQEQLHAGAAAERALGA